MHNEQKATLTAREQENIEALRLMLGLSMRKFISGQEALNELATALADTRLEVAKLTSAQAVMSREFSERAKLLDSLSIALGVADWSKLQVEVARLTEERDKLTEQRNATDVYANRLAAERDQQREDLRRLIEAAEGVRAMPGGGRTLLALLAE